MPNAPTVTHTYAHTSSKPRASSTAEKTVAPQKQRHTTRPRLQFNPISGFDSLRACLFFRSVPSRSTTPGPRKTPLYDRLARHRGPLFLPKYRVISGSFFLLCLARAQQIFTFVSFGDFAPKLRITREAVGRARKPPTENRAFRGEPEPTAGTPLHLSVHALALAERFESNRASRVVRGIRNAVRAASCRHVV